MEADLVSPIFSDSLLESFMEVVPDPCVLLDRAGRVLAVNRAWRELPRRSEAAVAANRPVGIDYLELYKSSIADEGLDRALSGIRAVVSGDIERFEHEYIRTLPHDFRWFRMTVRPWRQTNASAIIFHRDVTAEKFGRVSSQTVEDEFCSLADVAPALIWMSEPDKGCTFVNRRWLEFTGGRMEDQLGAGWLQFVHPDDRDDLIKTNFDAKEQKREFNHEYRLRHKDGAYRWVRDSGSPRYDSQGRLVGYIGSIWDLSDQKRADQEMHKVTRYARLVREVAEIANSSITMREALQRSVEVISEVMAFPGGHALLVDDDEPQMAKPANIVYIKDHERFKTAMERGAPLSWPGVRDIPDEVLKAGKPSIRDLLQDSRTPGKFPRSVLALEYGLRTFIQLPIVADQRVEAILEFASDEELTSDREFVDALIAACERLARFFERRRAQIVLLKKKEELEESAKRLFEVAGRLVDSQEDERRRIAREIHDDFTQRLALVAMKIGSLTRRDQESTPEELDAHLEEIRKSTAAVANDLRDLSHQLHPAMLELLGLVGALRAQCEEFERIRDIQTTFESSISEQDVSNHAGICLYRVLQEALMNVARHSGSKVAHVSLTRDEDNLVMQIRDEGRGFPTDPEGLSGIGLLNMKERVQFLNGTLTVNSVAAKGTEVIVRVPAASGAQRAGVGDSPGRTAEC